MNFFSSRFLPLPVSLNWFLKDNWWLPSFSSQAFSWTSVPWSLQDLKSTHLFLLHFQLVTPGAPTCSSQFSTGQLFLLPSAPHLLIPAPKRGPLLSSIIGIPSVWGFYLLSRIASCTHMTPKEHLKSPSPDKALALHSAGGVRTTPDKESGEVSVQLCLHLPIT